MSARDPLPLLQDLIRCPSITPAEAGALSCLEARLKPAGFACDRLTLSEPGTPDVENLFARFGSGGPHFCFAGHVDVVPPGNEGLWSHPPFAAEITDGFIYGRGACDMKGAVAAFAAAALDYVNQHRELAGSVSLLITCDEEGPAINGTAKVLRWLAERDTLPDDCLVGEPTSTDTLGDAVKIGRRGSLHFEVTARGVQGHTAYPHLADNPIPRLARLIDRIASAKLDSGTEHFDPTTISVTTFDVSNQAGNVIPETARARFNIRFNRLHTAESLKEWMTQQCDAVSAEFGASFEFTTGEAADCFLTKPGPLVETVASAIERETGTRPRLSTSGGTSDARFIKDYCPVVELGPTNATIHKADERIALSELAGLTRIYRNILEGYFGAARS